MPEWKTAWSSVAFSQNARQKLGGIHLTYSILSQLPVLSPASFKTPTRWHPSANRVDWLLPRVVELIYADWSLEPFARDCGHFCPPFKWNPERRLLLQCEIDAAFFHFYGLGHSEAEHILDSFNLVRDRDVIEYGGYRTKSVILEVYGAMAEAIRAGVPYQTLLDPLPADPRVAHSSRIVVSALPAAYLPEHLTILDGLKLVADNAWAAPSGVTAENVALFALIDVLRCFGQLIDSYQVRVAALLARKPALALAFLGRAEAKEWVRVVGQDAQPLPTNVIDISQFQREAVDLAWAEAFNQLSGSGALVTSSGSWSAGPNLPQTSAEEWVSGRAAVAVRLASEMAADLANEHMNRFLRSVEDGTARKAIS